MGIEKQSRKCRSTLKERRFYSALGHKPLYDGRVPLGLSSVVDALMVLSPLVHILSNIGFLGDP